MELSKSIRDLKLILYGNNEAEPVAEACAQLTQEFFKGDTLRRLLTSLPNLNLEVTSRPLMITSKERQLTVCNSSIRRDYLSLLGQERCYSSCCKSSEATSQFTSYCI